MYGKIPYFKRFSRKLPVQDGGGFRSEQVADKAKGRVSGRVGYWRSRFMR